MADDRLDRQLAFILEIDKLKSVLRRSYLLNGKRTENSAEHSWHIATMALVLSEHADEEVDLARVVRMLLTHDLVEIDAGDTFCYDEVGAVDKAERETHAADRIFGLLDEDQRKDFRALWDEFEAFTSPESRFANALDRLMPLLHNYHTQGRAWREHGITRGQVIERNCHIRDGSQSLWRFARGMIDDAVDKGYLAP